MREQPVIEFRGFGMCGILIATLIFAIIGCTTSQQKTTFNALSTVETLADASYSNYVALVIKGNAPTNQLPQVSKAYNDLHAAITLAAALNQSGTNALVPTNVTVELTDLLNLIATATTK